MSLPTSTRWSETETQDLSPVMRPTVLVGVDVVDAARVQRGMALDGDSYERHLCSPVERAPLADDESLETGLAARLALKECMIKVMGRRPQGFTWRDVQVTRPARAAAGSPSGAGVSHVRCAPAPSADALASALGRSTDVLMRHRATVCVAGASAGALCEILACTPEEIVITAAWGAGHGVVIAVAAVHARSASWDRSVRGESIVAPELSSATDILGGTAP